jgi:DNA-binding response OmpR family regulator
MTILVVDDEIALSEILQDQFEDGGNSCLTAKDIDEAEWMLLNVQVDVLVVDLETPGRGVMEWLQELCLARPALTRSTVVISGRDLSTDEMLIIQGCGATVLRKPFPVQSVLSAVLAAVRRTTPSAPDEIVEDEGSEVQLSEPGETEN